MDTSLKSLHKNFMEWIAGPTGSVIIHVALILALLFLVDLSTKEEQAEIEVKVIEVDEQELDELLEELEPPEELPEVEVTPPDVEMDMTPPPDVQDFAAQPDIEPVELNIASDALSPIILKNLAPGNMANRSGAGRAASIGAYGGKWGQYAEAAVLRALESFDTPIVLLMGGLDKGDRFERLAPSVAGKVKQLIAMGAAAETIARALKDAVPLATVADMNAALSLASRHARSGDVVLLSPGCASFDQYENYAQRGNDFKQQVGSLK